MEAARLIHPRQSSIRQQSKVFSAEDPTQSAGGSLEPLCWIMRRLFKEDPYVFKLCVPRDHFYKIT